MSQDPDFRAVAAEAGDAFSRLFPSPADVEAQLRDALARTRAIGGSTGELAAGLIEVIEVVHGWYLQSGDDPDAVLNPREAGEMVMTAIRRGLGG